jgi:hypothetical protein
VQTNIHRWSTMGSSKSWTTMIMNRLSCPALAFNLEFPRKASKQHPSLHAFYISTLLGSDFVQLMNGTYVYTFHFLYNPSITTFTIVLLLAHIVNKYVLVIFSCDKNDFVFVIIIYLYISMKYYWLSSSTNSGFPRITAITSCN